MTQERVSGARLDGAQLEQLCDATAAAFDTDSLRQLVRFKLGKELGKIVDCKRPFRTIVFDLLMVAEEEGWIPTLVIAIARVRMNNPQVMAFVEAHAPWAFQSPKPGDLSDKVKTGLNTVAERKDDAGVRDVLVQFRADLQGRGTASPCSTSTKNSTNSCTICR